MSEFMVVMRGGDPAMKKQSPNEVQQAISRYNQWVDDLRQTNRYRGGSPLKDGSKLLSAHKNFVVIQDGPYAKREEALTGYFIIHAGSIREAVEVAKTCPALTFGETVEVIQLDNNT